MKKYLLTGGFAAMLLLAACGNEEPETAEETMEEESTEEETAGEENEESEEAEAVVDEEVDEAADAVEDEEPQTLDEVNEEIAGEDGLTQVYGYNDEEVTEQLDTLNVTRNYAIIAGMEVDEEMSWYFTDEDYSVGDEVQMLTIEYTVENTVEDQRNFYLDQTSIVTSTGEQIESEYLISEGLQSEMLGAVESTGEVIFFIRNSDAEEIEWVDVIIPSVSGSEYSNLSEEFKQRIEIKSE